MKLNRGKIYDLTVLKFSRERSFTVSVLKTTVLQSGSMLIDRGGRRNSRPLKFIVCALFVSLLAKKAAQMLVPGFS